MSPRPTPAELLDAPELAILAVLRTTLDATVATLTSVHPDLYSPDDHVRDPVFPGSSAIAGTLITLIRALEELIDVYRRLADTARERAREHAPVDF